VTAKDHSPATANRTSSKPAGVLALPGSSDTDVIRTPQDRRETPCSRSVVGSGDPNPWFDPKFYPYLALVCAACPFLQWCATEALALRDNGYRVIGMWATVDFTEDDAAGRYRRRIQKLEKIAATGKLPRSRRGRINKTASAA
jgi:hypothetical protein